MLIPLQQPNPFSNGLIKPQAGLVTYLILGIVLVAFVLLIVIGNYAGSRNEDKNSRKFNKRLFRREGLRIGLSKDQVDLLINLVRIYHVNRPFDLLMNSRTLNNTLAKTLRDIDKMQAPPEIIEKRKLDLFRIKQKLERIDVQTNRLDNTRQLKLSQQLSFVMENQDRYQTVVTANVKEFFCAKIPINKRGEQIRWKKGQKVVIKLWGRDGEEQTFVTKNLGYKSVKGVTSILLQHTSRINRSYTRQFRRKNIKINCYVFPIQIIISGRGKRARKEALVGKDGKLMAMTDISAGGCRLQTASTMPRGELVKLRFEPHRGTPVTALGKIVDVRQNSRIYYNLHIMFTRASSKNLNLINEYIYDFD